MQYKICGTDACGPTGGYLALHTVPPAHLKPPLATVSPANLLEVTTLDEFIAIKQRSIRR